MHYHIEQWVNGRWVRVLSSLPSSSVARNMKKDLAKRNRLDPDNYSILVEVDF